MKRIIKKADILVEALPYIRRFKDKVLVIKYGGSILEDETVRKNVLEDIACLHCLGLRPVLVHGGGPHISRKMQQSGIETKFVDGMRITDKRTLLLVQGELKKINSSIVAELEGFGVKAKPLAGTYKGFLTVKRKLSVSGHSLGLVGTVTKVKTSLIADILSKGLIPVVMPVGVNDSGQRFNVNADEAAARIAVSLKAEKIVLLTNVDGIMKHVNKPQTLMDSVTLAQAQSLIEDEFIQGGMIPKVKAGLVAVHNGVNKAHIINARLNRALLLEIFTKKGVGTQIIKQG